MKKLQELFRSREARGLSAEQRRVIEWELRLAEQAGDPEQRHQLPLPPRSRSLYAYNDPELLQQGLPSPLTTMVAYQTLDRLLERDLQREKDGFPRKIRVGKLVKPGRDGDD